MPEAATEYGFAASGDCLVTAGRTAYFGSGGGAARVFRSTDFGLTWTASNSTIPAGGSAVATTRDGSTAHHAGDLAHLGEDAAYLPGRGHRLIVTGESGEVMGASVSADGGRSWTQVSETGFHALDCTRDGSCWAAGAGGRVARLTR